MKKLSLLLLSALILCGCKKSTSNPTPQITIVGKWVKNKTVSTETVNGRVGATTETLFSDPNNYMQFNSNGTGTASTGGNGSYILTNFTYSVSGSMLIVPHNFGVSTTVETQTITTLTSSNLTIHTDLLVHNTGDIPYEYVTDDYYSK